MRISKIWHRDTKSKCCQKNGTDGLAQCRIATSPQFIKYTTSVKHSKMTYACIMFYFLHILHLFVAAAAKSLQSWPTLCDPMDSSPPGSPVPGILQARTLEWVAISFSNAWKWKVKVKSLSRAWVLATRWTTAHQAPPSMGFSRQTHWSGLPFPSPITFT